MRLETFSGTQLFRGCHAPIDGLTPANTGTLRVDAGFLFVYFVLFCLKTKHAVGEEKGGLLGDDLEKKDCE